MMTVCKTEAPKKEDIKESKLSDKQLQDFIYRLKASKSETPKEEIKESVVHMTDNEHFNPIATAEALKVGDEIYDDKSGHKWRVLDIDTRSQYHRDITFLDVETNREFTKQVGNLSLFEMAVDGDTSYEVTDDIEFETHPIDDYFDSYAYSIYSK